jgi:hypothetical protein
MSQLPENIPVWIEASDLQKLSYEKATWIPLATSGMDFVNGKYGYPAYREAFRSIETLVVPLAERTDFDDSDWQSINRSGGTDGVWADDERLRPPGHFQDGSNAVYPVIHRHFDSGEMEVWVLLQEIEVGLRLLRKGDEWIRPSENDVVVIKLNRRDDGRPREILIRAEHLRDYLCARKSALLVCAFYQRTAIEEKFGHVPIKGDKEDSTFASGEREIVHQPIHEGGTPFGVETAVMRVWRESVDPKDDLPVMPKATEDPGVGSESYTVRDKGRKLHRLSVRIWTKHWVEPAAASPRIRRDEVEARTHFFVDNQEQKSLAGKPLHDYLGWLWFKPEVIPRLLAGPKAVLSWYTQETGEVGPAPDRTLHFGVNKLGLINVLGYKMADLPEWAQKIWVTDNVPPEGGLSEELHMSQNLAKPASTDAPEELLWLNLNMLQGLCLARFDKGLFISLPSEKEFYRRIHRFHATSFESVCELCKELHRTVAEQIDIGVLNGTIDPGNAAEANTQKLRQIKRVALWIDALGADGRALTRALAGVADLRQGDAHQAGSNLKESLALLHLSPDSKDYLKMSFSIIASVANCLGMIGTIVAAKVGPRPTAKP